MKLFAILLIIMSLLFSCVFVGVIYEGAKKKHKSNEEFLIIGLFCYLIITAAWNVLTAFLLWNSL